jgi:hypothetical protein
MVFRVLVQHKQDAAVTTFANVTTIPYRGNFTWPEPGNFLTPNCTSTVHRQGIVWCRY